MCKRRLLSGPQFGPAQTCPPLELSTSLCESQQIGGSYVYGGESRLARSSTPRKLPFFTKLRRHVGVHVPSLSATVSRPMGLAPMPLGARTPVANTSNFDPSFETFSTQPL